MSRRPNAPHRSKGPFARDIPLLVGDYCFVRDSNDTVLQTILVCRMYPQQLLCAIPVSSKGAVDAYAVHRLASFIENTGIKSLVYLSDQESALRRLFEASSNHLASDSKILQAVPEVSAVGESQSNGAAERSVQALEDLLRCYKFDI